MARQARIDLPNHYYHIICRGQRKNPLFFSDKDKDVFLNILSEVNSKHDIDINSFSLMKNHIHFSVFRNTDSLGSFMRKLNTRYALYFNKKYNLVGHVYQGRYKSFIVLNENYLNYLIKYINLNSMRAGIVINPADDKYSSEGMYEGLINFPFIKKIETFSGKNGVKKYLNFINNGKVKLNFYKDSIGTKEEYIKFEKRKNGREKSHSHDRRKMGKPDILEEINSIVRNKKYSIDNIRSEKRNSEIVAIRKIVILKLFKIGFSGADISRAINKSEVYVSRIIKNNFWVNGNNKLR